VSGFVAWVLTGEFRTQDQEEGRGETGERESGLPEILACLCGGGAAATRAAQQQQATTAASRTAAVAPIGPADAVVRSGPQAPTTSPAPAQIKTEVAPPAQV
jgi:hypothetical protein